MATPKVLNKSTFEINIPLRAYSNDCFDTDIQEERFSRELEFDKPAKVDMTFYKDDVNGGFLLTISFPNNDIATKDEETEKVSTVNQREGARFLRIVQALLKSTAYLIVDTKKDIYFDVVTDSAE